MPSAPAPDLAAPAAAADRVALVDALRGAAMLGIVLVNFPSMNTLAGEETTAYGGPQGPLDRAVNGANLLFLNGKFYPIFALLFGLSLFLFDREGRSGRTLGLAARRLVILAALGALHVTLVWWGDILLVYAVLGLLALPALRAPPRAVLAGAIALLLVPLLSLAPLPPASLPGLALALPSPEEAAATYAAGTFAALVRQRWLDWLSDFTPFAGARAGLGLLLGYAAYFGQLLGLFLLGVWAGRRGLHLRLGEDRALRRRLLAVAAPVALALTGARAALPEAPGALGYAQAAALSLTYVLAFVEVAPARGRLRAAFEAVGRMSLTAYLSHTVAASLLLHATGLGRWGSVGGAALLPIALACYAAVAAGCAAWLRRFRLGPAEWVWRSLVVGSALPLARDSHARSA
ncbi:MAG: DUF418 domain-containing protein [Anaeromyxobacter sp.]